MHKRILYLAIAVLAWITIAYNSCNTDDKPARRVVVIHSYESTYAAYPDFNAMIEREFRSRGIAPEIHTFYLDCESYRKKEELRRMNAFIDSVASWNHDIILVNEDQAAYSLLKCGHPLTKTVPIVFAGVNYPNWELIGRFDNVTGFHDKIYFKANIRLARELFGDTIELFTIIDSTFLDCQIMEDARQQLKDEKVAGPFSANYRDMNEARKELGSNSGYFYWNTMSIRRKESAAALICVLSKYAVDRRYIQLKRDFTTGKIGNISSGANLTAINEAFGYGEKLLGG